MSVFIVIEDRGQYEIIVGVFATEDKAKTYMELTARHGGRLYYEDHEVW